MFHAERITFIIILALTVVIKTTNKLSISKTNTLNAHHHAFLTEDTSNSSTIALQFHPALPGSGPYRNASMGNQYRCTNNDHGNVNRAKELPSSLRRIGLFDFATIIKSKLGVLFVGDSIMQQLSEAYDESSGIKRDDNASSTQSKNGYRQLLWGGGGYRETLSVSPQVYGGGYSAYWRMTDIWREQNKNKPVPNAEGGGWNDLQLRMITDAVSPFGYHGRIFDAMVLGYNSWIFPVDPSIEQKYWDAIQLAKDLTGVNAIILVTYPSSKLAVNSTSVEIWKNIHATNQMIRRVSAINNLVSDSPKTLVLDFANFANQIFWMNARSLGLNVSDPYQVAHERGWELRDDISVIFQPLNAFCDGGGCCGGCFRMPTFCSEYKDDTPGGCKRNLITYDDLHWCTESVGARFSAGIACLLGCAFNECPGTDVVNKSAELLALCEKRCNDQFMALSPISPEMLKERFSSAC